MKNIVLFLLLITLYSCNQKTAVEVEPEVEKLALEEDMPIAEETVSISTETPNDEYISPEKDIDVDLANSYKDMALTKLIDGDLTTAETFINSGIDANPNDADIYYIKGNIIQQKGNLEGAIENYLEALRLSPSHSDATSKIAICYGKMDDMVNFCIYAKRACSLGDSNACNMVNKFCN